MKTMNASDFKAKCLAVLDEVNATHEVVTILKRGKPVAQLVPFRQTPFAQARLKGSVTILGDVVSPVLPASEWEAEGTRK